MLPPSFAVISVLHHIFQFFITLITISSLQYVGNMDISRLLAYLNQIKVEYSYLYLPLFQINANFQAFYEFT